MLKADGIVADYYADENSHLIYLDILLYIDGCEKCVRCCVPSCGTDYDLFCNNLFLYRKDNSVDLELLPGTYVTAVVASENGTHSIESIKLNIYKYQF